MILVNLCYTPYEHLFDFVDLFEAGIGVFFLSVRLAEVVLWGAVLDLGGV